MNKNEFIKKIKSKTSLTQKEVKDVVDVIAEIIVEEISKESEVSISGFGKFFAYKQKERPVMNLKTNTPEMLKSYISLKFKPSKIVKNLLKEKSK